MSTSDPTHIDPRAESIFLDAIDFHDEAEQFRFLEEVCGEDSALRTTVESMLKELPEASQFFEKSSKTLNIPIELLPDEELFQGKELGPYRIVQLLGEGGSSKVYEAEQETPVKRRVALKILKLGMDTRSVIQRFDSERQTLAMLEHANICRVFDAGTTPTGRPFFVMEKVHGTKITDYCQQNKLTIEQSLAIMSQICSAVQHAHNKGIIHRDIKPSNILVSDVDGVPTPKLIDFGIAKATDPSVSEGKTLLGQPIGTPAYMSPEQFSIGGKDIDTRSDIFSIGNVIYELLAGEPPFNNDDLLEMGWENMRQKVGHELPKPPIESKPRKTGRSRNELNWVVMKAIAKDREQRYSTAHALATDLESYLRNEPVNAHPASRLYRFRKLLERNPMASISTGFAILMLIVGLSISTVLYTRAKKAETLQTQLKEQAEERAHITRAAILIMQDRIQQADDEIRKMGGVLTQPSLEATNVFRTLAIWNANHGDWKTSADRWLAMSRVNQFDATDTSDKVTENLLPIAPILVKIGDTERYQEFQNFLITKIGKSIHPFAAEHLLKLCLLTPAEPELLSGLQHAATIAQTSLPTDMQAAPVDWMEGWRCVALAMWYYRNGAPEKAIPWCNRSLLRNDWDMVRSIQTLLIRAICRSLTGEQQGAMKDFEIAEASVIEHLKQPLDHMQDGHFHDWLIAEILLKEAQDIVFSSSNNTGTHQDF